MSKIIRLTETDLMKIVRRVISEQKDDLSNKVVEFLQKEGFKSIDTKGKYKFLLRKDTNDVVIEVVSQADPNVVNVSHRYKMNPENNTQFNLKLSEYENNPKVFLKKVSGIPQIMEKGIGGLDPEEKKEILSLMKKVWLRYKPLGTKGLSKNTKVDPEVLKLQKYFNLSKDIVFKYGKLKENGIFDYDTYWQVNNDLGSQAPVFWRDNKYN